MDFLASVGQSPVAAEPGCVDFGSADESSRAELEIYLRVWHVLHPDVRVELAA